MSAEEPKRLVDDVVVRSDDARAVALLKLVSPPAALSAAASARVRDRAPLVARARRSARRKAGWAAVAACVALGVFSAARLRPTTPLAPARVEAAIGVPGRVTWLTDGAIALVGVGALFRAEAREIDLARGTVLLHAIDEELVVHAGRARVRVLRGGLVEVRVDAREVRIAAYQGRAEVTWIDLGTTVILDAGTELTVDGARAVDAQRRQVAIELFAPPVVPAAVAPSPSPPHRRVAAVKVTAPPVAGDDGAERARGEADLLARAVSRLRRDHDPEGALTLVAEYRASFPRSALGLEVQRTEVESLLQLGRRGAALVALDEMSLGGDEGRGELRLVRGELRANAGRCSEAIGDFDAVLLGHVDALAERALYGRASCRTRLHDADAARADLGEYLRRYPTGRFAGGVRAALGSP